MSKIIVIEGPDRVGKATQAGALKEHLLKKDFTVAIVEVPLKSNFLYHIVYWMLGNGLAKKFPKFFQWCQYFNRQIFQWTILPKLEKHCDYIIFDRWSLSTIIYGAAAGVSLDFTQKLYDRLRKPDFTVVLLGQSHGYVPEDTYEADDKLQSDVRRLYDEWCEINSDILIKIDCNQRKEDITKKIIMSLEEIDLL